MKSAPSLLLEPRRSRVEVLLLVVISLLAIFAVALSGLALTLKCALILVTLLMLARHLQRRARAGVARYVLQGDGDWLVESGDGVRHMRLSDQIDLGFLIALQFIDTANRRDHLALWPDTITLDARRRLRAWLRQAHA